jgi:hypothetical protein
MAAMTALADRTAVRAAFSVRRGPGSVPVAPGTAAVANCSDERHETHNNAPDSFIPPVSGTLRGLGAATLVRQAGQDWLPAPRTPVTVTSRLKDRGTPGRPLPVPAANREGLLRQTWVKLDKAGRTQGFRCKPRRSSEGLTAT